MTETKPITKTLVLRKRMNGRWHDSTILEFGLEQAVKGKSLGKMALLMSIAHRLEIVRAEAETPQGLPDFSINISLAEIDRFWAAITKLQPEAFGRDIRGQLETPHLGLLMQMLTDFAEQLGVKMPEDTE